MNFTAQLLVMFAVLSLTSAFLTITTISVQRVEKACERFGPMLIFFFSLATFCLYGLTFDKSTRFDGTLALMVSTLVMLFGLSVFNLFHYRPQHQ